MKYGLNECMSADEKAFWYKIGKEIADKRKSHTRHGLDDNRRRCAITQADLGKAIGLSRCSIATIELGIRRINLYTHKQIMEFLK